MLIHFNPQTTAMEISNCMIAVGKYGCLAMCYAWCVDARYTEGDFLLRLCQAVKEGVLDSDCYVSNAQRFCEWWGNGNRKFEIGKKKITTLQGIIEPTPVRFLAKGHGGHWVVVQNEEIVFNPLSYSFDVERGTPVDSRIITEV